MELLRGSSLRWVLALAIALAVSIVTAAAAAPIHGHAGISADACNLCHFAHLPFEFDAATPQVWPPQESILAIAAGSILHPSSEVVGLSPGRAPPRA